MNSDELQILKESPRRRVSGATLPQSARIKPKGRYRAWSLRR